MNVQEIAAAVLAALQQTPQWEYVMRKYDERHVRPDKHTVGPGQAKVDKYEQRVGEAAMQIHSDALNSGRRMDYDEARAAAEKRIKSGSPGPERYTQRRGEAVEDLIALTTIDLHTEAAERGQRRSHSDCRAEALGRLGFPA